MTSEKISEQLEGIASAEDFANAAAELTEAWSAAGVGAECIGPILRFTEEHPALDYGTPGPLVHFMEEFHRNGYEGKLAESVARKPTMMTAWMLNRVLNGTGKPSQRQALVRAMRQAARNPNAE